MTKLNEEIVKALPVPEAGNKVHYFPDAVLQGARAPRGFGVRITAAGVRSFVMNYRIGPVERRYTIGRHPDWSVLNAVKKARELRQQIDGGNDPLADRRKQEAAIANTFKAICEEYVKRDGAKLRTREWRERVLERLVYPELGSKDIAAIRRSDINRLLDKIEDECGPVMADRTLAVVRKVMNWHASRSDDYSSPVVRGMSRHADKARERVLSDDELRAVWRAAEASTSPFAKLVQFILLTGARRSEAAEMMWGEIADSVWVLPASRNKTSLELARPLNRRATAVLPAKNNGPFVFSTGGGHRPISGFTAFRKSFYEASGTAGWTVHDLRRTARTLMSRAGVSTDIAERCLGHAVGGIRGIYDRHRYIDEMAGAYQALANLIERIVNPADNVTAIKPRAGRVK